MDQLPKDLIQRLPEFIDRHVKAAESEDWPSLVKNDRFKDRSSSSDPASDALKLIVYRRLLAEHQETMVGLWKRELAIQMDNKRMDFDRNLQPLCLSLQYTFLSTNSSRALPQEDAEVSLCLALYVNLAYVCKCIVGNTLPSHNWLHVLVESLGRRPGMVDALLEKYKDRPDVIQGWSGWLTIFWIYATASRNEQHLRSERNSLELCFVRIAVLFRWPVPQENMNHIPSVLRVDLVNAARQPTSAERFALIYANPEIKATIGTCDFGCQNCLAYFAIDTIEKARMRLDKKIPKFSCCSLCNIAMYCSTTCQKQDWEKHKGQCAGRSKKKQVQGDSSK